LRNPDYIDWWLAIIEDQVKSYPIDGLMFGSERNGPLGNTIGGGGFARNANPYCFCRHCLAAADRRGIDARRAGEAYQALHELTQGEAKGSATDSPFVRFLRLIMTYPELVAWDQLWQDGYRDLQKRIYGTVKFLAPDVQVGWHIWHHNSFSPLYRAQMDLSELAGYADFIKPVVYNNCAGYRLHHHISQVAQSIFGGVNEETIFELYRSVLGYGDEVSFQDLPASGLSADYVTRETRRAVQAVAGQARVYPGLDMNVPTPAHVKKTGPEEVEASVKAAIAGGADGLVLSRKYSEMTLENLAAVGTALRGLGPDWAR
jgi:hypothetical protein